jgi:hypothetical protein
LAGFCRSPAGSLIAALDASQHAAVRKALLGDTLALEQLRIVDSEIAAL